MDNGSVAMLFPLSLVPLSPAPTPHTPHPNPPSLGNDRLGGDTIIMFPARALPGATPQMHPTLSPWKTCL